MLVRLRNAVAACRHHLPKGAEVVVATDTRPYWRSEVFPNYKKNRKPLKQVNDIDWDTVFEVSDALETSIDKVFGWSLVKVQGAEADDIIGTLVYERMSNSDIIIVSRDGDFKQLHHGRVRQWDNITNKFIVEKDPTGFLNTKILTGDAKDGIPNILSSTDTFVTEGMKQTPMRKANLNKWVGEDPKMFCTNEMLERWYQNQELLDLSRIPQSLKESITQEYTTASKKTPGNIWGWIAERGHGNLIQYMEDFK
jgi:5'-3' exonuclease